MTLTRAALMLTLLAATGTCLAGGKEQPGAAPQSKAPAAAAKAPASKSPEAPQGADPAAVAPQDNPLDQPQGALTPRKPLNKLAVVKRPSGESRLFVKFRDDAKIRVAADKSLLSRSSADASVAEITAVANQFNITFVPAIHQNEAMLQSLEARAATHSHKAQPDLAGMMYVDGPDQSLQAAAQALRNLNSVEFVYFQPAFHPYDIPVKGGGDQGGIAGGTGACCIAVDGAQNCVDGVTQNDCETQGGLYEGDGSTCAGIPGGCPILGACCLIDQTCVPLDSTQCSGLGGAYKGDGTNCFLDTIDCNNNGCGDPANGSCFLPHDGLPGDPDPGPYCDNQDCCALVGGVRDFCINPDIGGNWDIICVAIAQLICAAPPADRCASVINGNCFTPHPTGGCNDSVCCNIICALDTFCCEVNWDVTCVELANSNCIVAPPNGPTPNFAAQQGYLRRTAYADQPGGPPLGLSVPAPDFPGYGGEGWYLFDDSLLSDDPTVLPASVRYAGLYGIGRQLHEVYHVGTQNGARGAGIKVAVIEWAYYQNHEDLNVISEPGQTLIMIPDITEPTHATACLGIINAKDNGFGVVGIAPDAQAYFFPLTSIEEGPRFLTAFINCYNTLSAGDVVSCSFGPGGSNLNNEPAFWTLMRMGSDLGIVTCVAAGNDCFKLDDLPNGDIGNGTPSGAIVVGAGTPGDNHCRLVFSNHFETVARDDSRHVDIQAWGECTTSCATSNPNLFFPNNNWNRSYGSGFNGTSSATPQIAGLIACVQGLAKQFYGIPLSADAIKTVIGSDGFPQCGVLNPADLPGFPEPGCGPDTDPDEQPNRIGPYPRPDRCAAAVLSQSFGGFDGSPLIDDVVIIRGVLQFGNVFSIKASDQNYLVVSTLFTEQNFQPSIPGPASQVSYLSTGQTADLMVVAHSDKKTATAMLVDTEIQQSGVPTIMMVEMYDWVAQEWAFVGFTTGGPACPDGTDACNQFVATLQPTRFINPANLQVLIRLYTIGMGGPDPNAGNNNDPNAMSFPIRYDQVNLSIATGFGQGGGPGSP